MQHNAHSVYVVEIISLNICLHVGCLIRRPPLSRMAFVEFLLRVYCRRKRLHSEVLQSVLINLPNCFSHSLKRKFAGDWHSILFDDDYTRYLLLASSRRSCSELRDLRDPHLQVINGNHLTRHLISSHAAGYVIVVYTHVKMRPVACVPYLSFMLWFVAQLLFGCVVVFACCSFDQLWRSLQSATRFL